MVSKFSSSAVERTAPTSFCEIELRNFKMNLNQCVGASRTYYEL